MSRRPAAFCGSRRRRQIPSVENNIPTPPKKKGGGEQSASRLLLGKKGVGRQQGQGDETDPRSLFSLPRLCLGGEMSTGKPKQEGKEEARERVRGAVGYSSIVTINHYLVIAIDQQSPGNWYQQRLCYLCARCHKHSKCSLLLPLLLFYRHLSRREPAQFINERSGRRS